MLAWISIATAYAALLDTLLVVLWACGVGELLPRGSEEQSLKMYGKEFIDALRGVRHCFDCRRIMKAWWAWCVYLICSMVLMCADAIKLMDSTIGWHRTDLGLPRRKHTEALFKYIPRPLKTLIIPIVHLAGWLFIDALLSFLESVGGPLRHAPAKSMLLLVSLVILVHEICKMLREREIKAQYLAQTAAEHLHLVDEFMLVLPSMFCVQSALAVYAVMQMRHVLYRRKGKSLAPASEGAMIEDSQARERDYEQQRGRDIVWSRESSLDDEEARLREYAQLGDVESVDRLLDKGTNAAAVDRSRRSALHAVTSQKDLRDEHVEIAQHLLTRSLAPRDGYGKSALHYAAHRGSVQHLKIIEILQGHGLHQGDLLFNDMDGFNPMMLAARTAWRSRGNQAATNLIKAWLAKRSIPVSTLMQESYAGGTLLIYLVALGDKALVRTMVQSLSAHDQHMVINQNTGMGTALYVSLIIADDGDQDMPLLLLELGADPRRELVGDVSFPTLPGASPLMLATWRRFDDVVQRMLEYVPSQGWPPAELTKSTLQEPRRLPPSTSLPPPHSVADEVSSGGYSAASLAFMENNIDLFMLLLRHTSKAVLETRITEPREGEVLPDDATLLLLAVHSRNMSCARGLLERDVNVETVGADGKCALILVIEANLAIDWVRMLVTSRANVNVRHPNGKSAVELAAEFGRYNVMSELIDAGASMLPSRLRSIDRKAFLCKRIGVWVDLMFLVDTTYSMATLLAPISDQLLNFCKASKQQLERTLPDFQGDVRVRVHVVGFRDRSDTLPLASTCTHYTSDFQHVGEPSSTEAGWKSLESAFEQLKVAGRGGGDECEDLPGALLHALQSADWQGDHRGIIIFTDAPCHGRDFYDGADFEDDDPDASRNSSETFTKAFKLAVESDVNLQLCTCSGTRTDKMFDEMKRLLRELRVDESLLSKVTLVDNAAPAKNRDTGLPEHIIFCLDESLSMTGTNSSGSTRWDDLCKAFDSFWTATSRLAGAEWSTVTVVQFSSTARVTAERLPLQRQQPRLQQRSGGTCFMPAMQEVERLARQNNKHHKQVLIFMSDGETDDGKAASDKCSELVRNGLLSAVFTIGFTAGAEGLTLRQMASSPDKYLTALTGRELLQTFTMVSKEINTSASAKMVENISNELSHKLTAALRRVELEQSQILFSGQKFRRGDLERLLEGEDVESDLDC